MVAFEIDGNAGKTLGDPPGNELRQSRLDLCQGYGIEKEARLGSQGAEHIALRHQPEAHQDLAEAGAFALLAGQNSAQLVLVDYALLDKKLA